MAEFEEQVKGFWAKVIAWLRGGQRGDTAQKARGALQDMRTSETARKAEAAIKDLREGETGRKARPRSAICGIVPGRATSPEARGTAATAGRLG